MKIADISRLFRSKKGSYSEYQKWEVQGVQLWDKNAQLPPSNRKVLARPIVRTKMPPELHVLKTLFRGNIITAKKMHFNDYFLIILDEIWESASSHFPK